MYFLGHRARVVHSNPRRTTRVHCLVAGGVLIVGVGLVGMFFLNQSSVVNENGFLVAEGIPTKEKEVEVSSRKQGRYLQLSFGIGQHKFVYANNEPKFIEVSRSLQEGKVVKAWIMPSLDPDFSGKLGQLDLGNQTILSFEKSLSTQQKRQLTLLLLGGMVCLVGLWGLAVCWKNAGVVENVLPPTPVEPSIAERDSGTSPDFSFLNPPTNR